MDEMVYNTFCWKVQMAVCCHKKENNRVVDSFTGKLFTYYITQRNTIAIWLQMINDLAEQETRTLYRQKAYFWSIKARVT